VITAAQRHQKEYPVERICGAGDHLADHGLAAPLMRVPEWKAAFVPDAGLKLIPGQHLVADVRAVGPGVLVGKRELPENARDHHEQEGRPSKLGGEVCCPRTIHPLRFHYRHRLT